MKMNHDRSADCTRTIVETMTSLCEVYSSIILFFFREFMRCSMQTSPRRRQGRESSRPKVCLRSTGGAENRNRGVVQTAKRRVKITNGLRHATVNSKWYGLCFNLAQFTLHSSWHAWGCMNSVLVSPDMFYMRLEYCAGVRTDTPRVLLKCTRTVRKMEQLHCPSANLSFRPYYVYCMKPIKWKRTKPAHRFCLRIVHVQVNSRADYFDSFQ